MLKQLCRKKRQLMLSSKTTENRTLSSGMVVVLSKENGHFGVDLQLLEKAGFGG